MSTITATPVSGLTDEQVDFRAAIRDFAERECGTAEQREKLSDGYTPDPYDYLYHAAYHRPLSTTTGNPTCAIGPGTPDLINPANWPGTPFTYHTYNTTTSFERKRRTMRAPRPSTRPPAAGTIMMRRGSTPMPVLRL